MYPQALLMTLAAEWRRVKSFPFGKRPEETYACPRRAVCLAFFLLKGYRMPKTRVSVYIDGFNLYHSTLQFAHPTNRWLNLMELSKRIINPKTEEISAVYYFTALTTWKPEKAKKHLLYIHPIRTAGVKDILGKFTIRNRRCPLCA